MAVHVIRRAQVSELAAIRHAAPSLFRHGSAPDRVLVVPGEGDARGPRAFAAIAWRSWGQPPGFPTWVHVTAPCRRQGFGRALAQAVATEVSRDTSSLYSWDSLDDDGEAAAFARAIGFVRHRCVHAFEADGAAFYAMIDAVHARLKARGRMPAQARLVALQDASIAAVARLLNQAFGSRYESALAATRRHDAGGYDRQRSVVLHVGDELAGALLYRWGDGVPEIDVNVVAPRFRRRYANVMLLREATRRGLEGGATKFRFHCEERVLDTLNLARRAQAVPLRTSTEWRAEVLRLAAAPPAS